MMPSDINFRKELTLMVMIHIFQAISLLYNYETMDEEDT